MLMGLVLQLSKTNEFSAVVNQNDKSGPGGI